MKRPAKRSANRAGTGRFNPRAVAASVVSDVVVRSRYLDSALLDSSINTPGIQRREAALIQEITYGVLRWFHQLDKIASLFLEKPLKDKDRDIHALLLIGLYQLRHMRVARHAAVKETVDATTTLKKPWAKNLVNACLRSYLRETARAQAVVDADPVAAFSHPNWLIESIRGHWPVDGDKILAADNARPPMVLRINRRRLTREQYLARLESEGIRAVPLAAVETAARLETPLPVSRLPGFAEGDVSVQDAAAQWATVLLDAQAGERVLDACAAPGGKTGHLLEHTPALAELVALDREPERIALIEENLQRLGLSAEIKTGDAALPAEWWDGRGFDRILADVPCSATGVIRRHPDIKVRRKPADLSKLIVEQERILDGLWPSLKPGGKLLYVTCSILPDENDLQVAGFLSRHSDAQQVLLTQNVGRERRIGRQILPGEAEMDGFYYASIHKNK